MNFIYKNSIKFKIKKKNKRTFSRKKSGNPPLKKKYKNSNNKFIITKETINFDSKTFFKKNPFLDFNGDEINSLPYKDAVIYDKRNYCQYYCSLLKFNHLIIYSFYFINKDYNSQIMKTFLFFFSFGVDITINAFFYKDDSIHNIYEKKGKYDFIYHHPTILYSAIISSVIDSAIKYLAFTSNLVQDIKYEKKIDEFKKKKKSIYKKIKIRFVLFFIISFLLLSFFLFFVSCLCGVYVNSQFDLIRDALMSLISSFFRSFILLLIPGIFRISALRAKNKNKICLYKFSQYLE